MSVAVDAANQSGAVDGQTKFCSVPCVKVEEGSAQTG